jgi:hypothetical protein
MTNRPGADDAADRAQELDLVAGERLRRGLAVEVDDAPG